MLLMEIYGGEDLFKGTASYYSQYRPIYPSSLIRFLVECFSLDGSGNMLDLGCGTGQLTFRFSDWFGKVIGVDTDQEMIEEAKRISKEVRLENVKWHVGDLQDYKQTEDAVFKLVTIAKAFHWMDRAKVLESLYHMIPVGGGIAIIDNTFPPQVPLPWQETVNEVVQQWYGKERRAGNTTYSHPKASHSKMIEQSRFHLSAHQLPTYEQTWTIDSIIGNVYSTSYGSKRFLGEHAASFEKHLTEALVALDETGVFKEEVKITVNLALKQ